MESPGRVTLDSERVPEAVRELVRRLDAAGHATWLVGGCVRDLLRGAEVRDFDAATRAAPEEVLALFPHAIPIGVRHGTVMVPTSSGPVDVTSLRAGPGIEEDLAHRDFTVNAMAFDPLRAELLDPFDGRADLARRRLRAVRSAADRFREDPIRALRAARLSATLGLEADAEIEAAMPACAEPLLSVARERVRSELVASLLAPRPEVALALLRRTGIEAALAPGAGPDAAAVVAALPRDLELRLAGWLRGARAGSILKRLRFGRRRTERVERLLRLHPIEGGVAPERDAVVRRLLRRIGDDQQALFALRRAELAARGDPPAALARLRALEEAISRVEQQGDLALRRQDLALDGRTVMERLGCGPGPIVGRALAYLADRVVEDPACNTPERLAELLERWWQQQPGARQASAGGGE